MRVRRRLGGTRRLKLLRGTLGVLQPHEVERGARRGLVLGEDCLEHLRGAQDRP